MKKRYNQRSGEQKEIVLERIKELFRQAKLIFKKDKTLADRYVKLARELSMKFKISIPSDLKRQFCKHCYHYLMPGENCRIRTQKGKVVYYCLDCKKYMRFVLKKSL